jgi:hypothetical protein
MDIPAVDLAVQNKFSFLISDFITQMNKKIIMLVELMLTAYRQLFDTI